MSRYSAASTGVVRAGLGGAGGNGHPAGVLTDGAAPTALPAAHAILTSASAGTAGGPPPGPPDLGGKGHDGRGAGLMADVSRCGRGGRG